MNVIKIDGKCSAWDHVFLFGCFSLVFDNSVLHINMHSIYMFRDFKQETVYSICDLENSFWLLCKNRLRQTHLKTRQWISMRDVCSGSQVLFFVLEIACVRQGPSPGSCLLNASYV